MSIEYALREIKAHWTERQWWRKRFLTHVVSQYYHKINKPDADPLVERDWDNVVLLDACRYDLFKEGIDEHPLPGTLSKRTSVQSGTPGYLVENFAGQTFHDIVYVTANPYVQTELSEDTFYAVDHVWQDGWDDRLQTVKPETMRDRAFAAAERYPNKRLIIHFNQPHAPFIGDIQLDRRSVTPTREAALSQSNKQRNKRTKTPFEQLGDGERSSEEVWRAYRSNLICAMPSVADLLKSLEGLTIVTADHGNALGEFAKPFPIRVYGHPLGILIPALVNVPWHVHQSTERKRIITDTPEVHANGDGTTKERLRMLGYTE